MNKYQIMGQPTSYINQLSSLIDEEDNDTEWREKARKLQARRWRKILRG